MRWTTDHIPDQTGRVAVITGANSGLGLQSAHALAAKGATVVMACRSADKAAAAADEIRAATPDARLEVRALDLADLSSIAAFAEAVAADHDRLDVLLNNAGVMAIPRRETADGFEMQLGTNHLGHFALTGRLYPMLHATEGARIVNVASIAHTTGKMTFDDLMREQRYERWSVYGQSKLANLLFTYGLARRLDEADHPTLCVAAHPGYSDTNLQHVGPEMDGNAFTAWIMRVGNQIVAQPADRGALPQLYAATADDVEQGAYYGPDGFRGFWGWPTRVRSNRRSRDVADQERLWAMSEELTGVVFPGL